MQYVKQLIENGDGAWDVKQLDSSQYTVEGLLFEVWTSRGWAEATEQEYLDQLADAETSDEAEEESLESIE